MSVGGRLLDDARTPVRDPFQPAMYMLASHRNGTLYVGVTSHSVGRLVQHRDGIISGFTKDWVKRRVWFEVHGDMPAAIQRERRIKKWLRA